MFFFIESISLFLQAVNFLLKKKQFLFRKKELNINSIELSFRIKNEVNENAVHWNFRRYKTLMCRKFTSKYFFSYLTMMDQIRQFLNNDQS
jgi:hypothetical protein